MAHLLIVDDEPQIRTMIRKYAEFGGHTVSEAGDGMQAIRIAREVSPDLIVMDIMMPELDGFSAVREIRKHSSVPVIFLSARVSPCASSYEISALREGGEAIQPKRDARAHPFFDCILFLPFPFTTWVKCDIVYVVPGEENDYECCNHTALYEQKGRNPF